MFPCPHCHKTIEIGIGPDGKVPWYKFDPGDPKVGLGCGTLFLIAIIVYFCSGLPLRNELGDLRADIRRLEKKVETLAAAVRPGGGNGPVEKGVELPP